MSPSPSKMKNARARERILVEMGERGDSIEAICAATEYSVNTVYTLIPILGGQYDGIRARRNRPAVPATLATEYKNMVRNRGFRPVEACRVLGL